MLSDIEIKWALDTRDIVIDPRPLPEKIQPASIDVHVGNRWGRLEPNYGNVRLTDPSRVAYFEADSIFLMPHTFILAQLQERVTLSNSIVARIEGKSSVGRKGVAIHVTAGFVDPGWDGYLTLEIVNHSEITYEIHVGDPIGQIAFDKISPVERPYGHPGLGSHYQGSTEVRGSYD